MRQTSDDVAGHEPLAHSGGRQSALHVVQLPPSLGPGGEPATWLARPRGTGWTLPRRDDVLLLLDGLRRPAARAGV